MHTAHCMFIACVHSQKRVFWFGQLQLSCSRMKEGEYQFQGRWHHLSIRSLSHTRLTNCFPLTLFLKSDTGFTFDHKEITNSQNTRTFVSHSYKEIILWQVWYTSVFAWTLFSDANRHESAAHTTRYTTTLSSGNWGLNEPESKLLYLREKRPPPPNRPTPATDHQLLLRRASCYRRSHWWVVITAISGSPWHL
jgi:hypothetical protein